MVCGATHRLHKNPRKKLKNQTVINRVCGVEIYNFR